MFDLDQEGYNVNDFANGDEIAVAAQRQAERQRGDIVQSYRNEVSGRVAMTTTATGT